MNYKEIQIIGKRLQKLVNELGVIQKLPYFPLNYDLNIIDIFNDFGYEYNRPNVYINNKSKIVIKSPVNLYCKNLCNLIFPPVPTIQLLTEENKYIFIQPLVNLKTFQDRNEVEENILKNPNNLENANRCDFHTGNFGWYRNKLVSFDW